MSILIFGGAGFLGSHLCERMVKDGHDVICVDNFFTGTKHNILPLMYRYSAINRRTQQVAGERVETEGLYALATPLEWPGALQSLRQRSCMVGARRHTLRMRRVRPPDEPDIGHLVSRHTEAAQALVPRDMGDLRAPPWHFGG